MIQPGYEVFGGGTAQDGGRSILLRRAFQNLFYSPELAAPATFFTATFFMPVAGGAASAGRPARAGPATQALEWLFHLLSFFGVRILSYSKHSALFAVVTISITSGAPRKTGVSNEERGKN